MDAGRIAHTDPVLLIFTQYLLPRAWLGGVPLLYVRAIDRDRLPPKLLPTWEMVTGS